MKNNVIQLKDVLRTIGGKGIVVAVAVLLTVSTNLHNHLYKKYHVKNTTKKKGPWD